MSGKADRDRDTGALAIPTVGPAPANLEHAVDVRPPPILKGNRAAQRRFHAVYAAAPWLREADALFVGTMLWLQHTLEEVAQEISAGRRPLSTRNEQGREFLSADVRFIFEALREVRYTAEMLGLPASERTRMGLNAAQAETMVARIRAMRAAAAAA